MPPQARVGDCSQVPADAHGCPACPHLAIGPAIEGSRNVLTNSLPSVRVGDQGIHAACCGPNIWHAKMGSRSVLINGRKAHRLSDQVQHCGGLGKTMQGSPNVIVGDYSHGAGSAVLRGSGSETISTEFFFQFWGIPIDDALLLIKFSDGTKQHFQLRQGHLVVPHRSDKLIAKIELMPVEE